MTRRRLIAVALASILAAGAVLASMWRTDRGVALRLRTRQVMIASVQKTSGLSRSFRKYWGNETVKPDLYGTFYRFRPGTISLAEIRLKDGHLDLQFATPDGQPVTPRITVNNVPASVIALPKDPEPRRYDYNINVSNVGELPGGSLRLVYFPRAIYISKGNRDEPGQILIEASDIPVGRRGQISPLHHTPEDLAWARQEWPATGATDIERADSILIALRKKVAARIDIPSDQIAATPRQQYMQAVSGKDVVWCDQVAQMFHLGLISHGIDARLVRTGSDCRALGSNCFRLMNGHTSVEYYSRETSGWVWSDPHGGVLNANIEGTRLNLNQIIQSLDTPLEKQMRFDCFDDATGTVKRVTQEDKRIQAYAEYLRPGVTLTF